MLNVEDNESARYYNEASALLESSASLGPLDPTVLSAALSLSMYKHELQGEMQEALDIASRAFKRALDVLTTDGYSLPEDKYKEVTLLMQLLRDNMTMWSQGNN
eukprot:TRINITY_DN1893_c0_g2_i1.p1 TRINITY_DN1893_c0_g2~~TRINITY_DN1893_c0_g2_i1.p1  ORF type:complete len:104 (+),score=26.09 TRINITY_DN1893_c0_g2_i1:614-925(+)